MVRRGDVHRVDLREIVGDVVPCQQDVAHGRIQIPPEGAVRVVGVEFEMGNAAGHQGRSDASQLEAGEQVDLFIGPGSILLEVQFGSSKVDQFILRDTNNGALNVAAGYRFYF